MVRRLDPAAVRRLLVGQLGLRAPHPEPAAAGARGVLEALRCIQLDPLDRIGTNADLVAMARVDGLRRGEIYDALLPGHAFEHFAKERCLLPASAFPAYRDQAAETPWWHLSRRLERLPEGALAAVLDEVTARGPATPAELADHGRVEALEWSGWRGTPRVTTMALEVLWTRCQLVVCGRSPRGKRYDVPARALPDHAARPAPPSFARWALLERVEAAGLLARASGAPWSMLGEVRTSALPDALCREGALEEVEVSGSSRRYLAPAGLFDRVFPEDDGRMRILAPLDPLLWDRKLVAHAFGFDYVWEVYKPAAKRRWGYYVCPLLHDGALVGRFEGQVRAGELVVERLWRQEGAAFDDAAFAAAIARHAALL
jgi:uncharacterized protein YcaQ